MNAQDRNSVSTAMLSYQRLSSELPALADKISRLVESFRKGK
jgi:hypothetical protein